MKTVMIATSIVMLSYAHFAAADVCDFSPSNLIGDKAAVGTGVVTGAAAATGVGMHAAGIYAITHTAGMAMLGSTAAGASAAGTVGIIAGTGGVLGTVGAVLLSPFVIVPAAITAVGIGIFEGSCYLAETSPEEEAATE